MARKIKIPNERLKRFAREEHKRKKDIRNKRKYYLIVCEGEATEPNEKNTTRKIDRLWVVFDRDSFSAQDFNAAIQRCHHSDLGCAWSNEAFELWYLLHFQYYENAMSRRVYKNMIENHLKPFLGEDLQYEKNSERMYTLLKEHGNIEDAIRNAKRLAERFEGRQDYANHIPCTMVWELEEELMKLNIS